MLKWETSAPRYQLICSRPIPWEDNKQAVVLEKALRVHPWRLSTSARCKRTLVLKGANIWILQAKWRWEVQGKLTRWGWFLEGQNCPSAPVICCVPLTWTCKSFRANVSYVVIQWCKKKVRIADFDWKFQWHQWVLNTTEQFSYDFNNDRSQN